MRRLHLSSAPMRRPRFDEDGGNVTWHDRSEIAEECRDSVVNTCIAQMWLRDYYCTRSSHVSGKNQTNVKHFSVRTKICDQTGVFSAAMQSSLNISSLTVHLNMIVWKRIMFWLFLSQLRRKVISWVKVWLMLGKYLFDETLETLEHYQHSEASLDDFLNIPLVDL